MKQKPGCRTATLTRLFGMQCLQLTLQVYRPVEMAVWQIGVSSTLHGGPVGGGGGGGGGGEPWLFALQAKPQVWSQECADGQNGQKSPCNMPMVSALICDQCTCTLCVFHCLRVERHRSSPRKKIVQLLVQPHKFAADQSRTRLVRLLLFPVVS
eukprot:SAG22_NODE_1277_length_4907_cov_2.638311_5_plen_154_part_00